MVERLSYSQLNSFTTCGEQYRLERIVRVPRRPGWALIGGNAVHEATENHDLISLGVAVPAVTFGDIMDRRIAEAEEESGLPKSEFKASGRASAKWPDKENEQWWRANGPAMVQRWINFRRTCPWEPWFTPDGKPAIELEFDLWIDGGQTIIKGYIDRVFQYQGDLIVLDLKSGASKQPTPRQLGTYKLGVEHLFPEVTVKYGTFWDARTGATGAVSSLHRYDLARLEYQYGALKHARAVGLYLPAPSSMCNSCSVNAYCYEYNGDLSESVPLPWAPLPEDDAA